MKNPDNPYPHVVIRWMACAYDVRPVRFVTTRTGAKREIEVVVPPGSSEALQRASLLTTLLGLTRRTGRRMCAVFAPGDAAYVEPDGTIVMSGEPPSGGVQVAPFALTPERST